MVRFTQLNKPNSLDETRDKEIYMVRLGLCLMGALLCMNAASAQTKPPQTKLRATIAGGDGQMISVTPKIGIACRAPVTGNWLNRCTVYVDSGRKLMFEADPAPGYRIRRWSRPECGVKATCIYQMAGAETYVTVSFEPKPDPIEIK